MSEWRKLLYSTIYCLMYYWSESDTLVMTKGEKMNQNIWASTSEKRVESGILTGFVTLNQILSDDCTFSILLCNMIGITVSNQAGIN